MRRTEAFASVKFYQILSIFIFFIRLIILEDFIRLISYNRPCVRLGCSFFLATALHVLHEHLAHLVCKASALITTFAIVPSITLTVLAVERYNALLKPLRTELRLSEDSIKKTIALIWVASVFFKSRCEVEEKLRSENFAATQTIGFDNAE